MYVFHPHIFTAYWWCFGAKYERNKRKEEGESARKNKKMAIIFFSTLTHVMLLCVYYFVSNEAMKAAVESTLMGCSMWRIVYWLPSPVLATRKSQAVELLLSFLRMRNVITMWKSHKKGNDRENLSNKNDRSINCSTKEGR